MAPKLKTDNAAAAVKKRKLLSIQDVSDIFDEMDRPNSSQKAIALKYGLTQGRISQIKSEREKWESKIKNVQSDPSVGSRSRTSSLPLLDAELLAWFTDLRKKKMELSKSLLHEKAISLATKLVEETPNDNANEAVQKEIAALKSFKASDGFLRKFCKRHHILFKTESGEADSANPEAVEKSRRDAKEAIRSGNYALRDVFNLDETGLFWKMTPSKTLAFAVQIVKGTKNPKDRFTVACRRDSDQAVFHEIPNSVRLALVNWNENNTHGKPKMDLV